MSAVQVAELIGAVPPADLTALYNIVPTQPALAVRADSGRTRSCSWLRWGPVPSRTWQLGETPPLLINAQALNAERNDGLVATMSARGCLIPADGFLRVGGAAGAEAEAALSPSTAGQEPFAFAGLWERWVGPDGKALDSCAIITTEANGFMRAIHNRMPVILPPEQFARWLDPKLTKPAELEPLLAPLPEDALEMEPVSTLVNSGRVDDPRCIEPGTNSER